MSRDEALSEDCCQRIKERIKRIERQRRFRFEGGEDLSPGPSPKRRGELFSPYRDQVKQKVVCFSPIYGGFCRLARRFSSERWIAQLARS